MKTRGFTIVESLVAIAVLVLVIAAPLTLAERSLASADSASEQITAAYLAQEAIEFVRNLRDTNVIARGKGESEWLAGLDACMNDKGCGVDPTNYNENRDSRVAVCGIQNDGCTLWQHKGAPPFEKFGKLFGHPQNRDSEVIDQWERSAFQRMVSIIKDPNGYNAKVAVRVEWASGFGKRSLLVSTNLMPWYVR